MTVEELLAKLDAACLGRTPEESLRIVGNDGWGLWTSGPNKRYISTHVTADCCGMARVIADARAAISSAGSDT